MSVISYPFRKCVLAVALAGLCSLSAASASGNLTVTGAGNQTFAAASLDDLWKYAGSIDYLWVMNHIGIQGNFADSITFNLSSPSSFSYLSNALYIPGISDITSFTAQLDGTPLATSSIGRLEYSADVFQLASGFHTLQFAGNGSLLLGGWYQLMVMATPVPEPESYAFLFAGLGMMGAIMRYRRRSKTVSAQT